mgnify:CR=1 FL=1
MHMRAAGLILAVGLLCGCPGKQQGAPAQQSALLLGLGGSSGDVAQEGPAMVGSSAGLRVSLPQGADSAQLFGALLVSEPARLTQWHAEPADAVTFDGNRAVFQRTGAIKIWATWTDAQGRELTSNKLEFQVGQ